MTLLANARVVLPDRVLEPGWIEVRGDRIADVGSGPAGQPVDVDLGGRVVVPGFVDTHVHGGGGATFLTTDADTARQAAAFHLGRGTTTTYASLISAPLDELERQVRTLVGLVTDQTVAGIHLEGPWLSAAKCGAHEPSMLRAPAVDEVARTVHAGDGTVRMVTIAPELEHGLAAIEWLAEAGVVAAVGHTAGSYDTVQQALEAGARVATHLFNAMPAIHHREPGPVPALLADPRVLVELVADGIHLHQGVVAMAVAAAGADRAALVTDAMIAAGMPDDAYDLGGQRVRVVDGVARLDTGDPDELGSIAGSTLTMDAAFRFAVRAVGLSLPDATRLASTNPARVHGLTDVGALRPGLLADLVVVDDRLEVAGVMRRGSWVREPDHH